MTEAILTTQQSYPESPQLRHTKDASDWAVIHLDLPEKPDVSRLSAPTFAMRIDSAVVQMGGIAGVGTNDEYRQRGYARLVLEASTRYFTETGHDVAILFGIPDFYHKFGYAPVFPVTALRVSVVNAELTRSAAPGGPYTSRPIAPDDWPAMIDQHLQNNLTRTGVILRPAAFAGYRHGTQWRCGTAVEAVCNENNAVVGYVAFDDVAEACRIGDLGYCAPEVFPVLLDSIVAAARRRNVDEFEAMLPPDHPFVIYCRRCGGRVETVYERNANGMGRIINAQSLFEKLSAVLSRRRSASALNDWRGTLALNTDIGTVTLEFESDVMHVLPAGANQSPDWTLTIPQMRLMQLVMGYRSVADVALEPDVAIPGQAIPLMEILFPVGNPWMPLPDWF